jgi:hypothetical protein
VSFRPTGPVVPLAAGAAITGCIALLIMLAVSLVPGLRAAGSAGGAGQSGGPVTPTPAGAATPVTAPGYSPVEPVIRRSFADPAVIKAGDSYYAYGTNAGPRSPVPGSGCPVTGSRNCRRGPPPVGHGRPRWCLPGPATAATCCTSPRG